MIKDFLKEGTLYAISSVAAKGISLLLIPIFTAYFTTEQFGIIEILYVFSTLASGLFSWQLGQAQIRFLGEHYKDPERKKLISSTALWMVLISYFIGTSLLLLFRVELTSLLGLERGSHVRTFAVAMIAMAFNGVFLFLGTHLQALRLKKEFALSQFLHSFVGIILTYLFVITFDFSIIGVYYAAILVFSIVIMYQLFCLRKELIFRFSKSIAAELLKFSLPMVPAGLALIFFTLSDRILLSIFSTQAELGIYSVAFKFAFGLQLIISGYSMAIHPIVFQTHRDENTKEDLSSLLLGYTVVGALAVFLLSLFSIETVEIFTQKAYYGAFRVMPLLYATTWVGGFVMFASGMQVTKNTFLISAVICSALLVNIVLAYYLIPSMNIKGAALGTLLSTLLYVIGLFLVSMKLYPYHFARKSLVTLVSSTILFVITISVIFESIVIRMNVAAKFSVSFILLTMVIFFFIFRDLDKKPQN